MYGLEVTYRNTVKQDLKLAQIQRSCMLLFTKACTTVSCWWWLPIEYNARIRQVLYLCKRCVSDIDLFGRIFSGNDMYGDSGYTIDSCNLISVAFDKRPPTGKGGEIFSDGSKMRVGNLQIASWSWMLSFMLSSRPKSEF